MEVSVVTSNHGKLEGMMSFFGGFRFKLFLRSSDVVYTKGKHLEKTQRVSNDLAALVMNT
jgi:hypothetical protein